MEGKKHVIIFSHGFAVQKDNRGMFTQITALFPEAECVLFDYNTRDEAANTSTFTPMQNQVQILLQQVGHIKDQYPNAVIDMIGHSQGCRVIAKADASGIRKTIFITPPFEVSFERTLKRLADIPGSLINLEGISLMPRRDGSVTILPKEYWDEREYDSNPAATYNAYANKTDLTIIIADQDGILGTIDTSVLNEKTKVVHLSGNHNLSGEYRDELLNTVRNGILNLNS